ncbi:MAG: DNA replication/repair protein RecF [Candidatus Promineifilaceae bacterium]|nr:DNA replication/repair protein RecF [Candidatus Promineifilaceae bacterium]
MHVTHLSLSNYRNYGRLELTLPSGATLFHGNNAQGKTNLLEALYYLSTTRSPHASHDSQMINWEVMEDPAPIYVARLVANVTTKQDTKQLEMRLIKVPKGPGNKGFRREALVNNRKVRLMDMLGQLQVVMFLPEDVNLITESPNKRRRYLNIMLCQVDRDYCRYLAQYNKVIDQRNAVLRQFAEGFGDQNVLGVFTDRLIELGSKIYARRSKFFSEIGRTTQRYHYEELTGRQETLRIGYLPRMYAGQNGADLDTAASLAAWLDIHHDDPDTIAERFANELSNASSNDKARGVTSLGPHRDDWSFWIDGRNLSNYGSRGQQRSAILATKLAEIEWMAGITGEKPILLLDEVLAELDQNRRNLLLRTVQNAEQALLTATDPGMFSDDFLTNATSMCVSMGQIEQDKEFRSP